MCTRKGGVRNIADSVEQFLGWVMVLGREGAWQRKSNSSLRANDKCFFNRRGHGEGVCDSREEERFLTPHTPFGMASLLR